MKWKFRLAILMSNVFLGFGACSSDGADASGPLVSALAACRKTLGTNTDGGVECEDERRCAVVRDAPSETYSYVVKLHSVDGSLSSPVTKEVFDCAASVMDAAGASVLQGDEPSLLRVRCTYSQLTEALSWAVTKSWLPVCGSDAECSRCARYTPSACVEDPFCSTIYGVPIVGGIKGARTPIGCAVRECDPIETIAVDPNGACWDVACVPDRWNLDTDNLCRVQ